MTFTFANTDHWGLPWAVMPVWPDFLSQGNGCGDTCPPLKEREIASTKIPEGKVNRQERKLASFGGCNFINKRHTEIIALCGKGSTIHLFLREVWSVSNFDKINLIVVIFNV